MGQQLHQVRQLRGLPRQLAAQTPAGLDLHGIVDNFSAHVTDKVSELLENNARPPALHAHRSSWLNQVELFFSILERRLLANGELGSSMISPNHCPS